MELAFPPMVLCLDGSRFNHFNKIDGVFTNSFAAEVLTGALRLRGGLARIPR